MDENTDLTEERPSALGGSDPEPWADAADPFATPVSEPVAFEPLHTQSLWPDAGTAGVDGTAGTASPAPASVAPASPVPVAPASVASANTADEAGYLEHAADTGFVDTASEHVAGASLIEPPLDHIPGTSLVEPPSPKPSFDFSALNLDTQPAPDPQTRITLPTESTSLFADEVTTESTAASDENNEPEVVRGLAYDPASTTEFPPIRALDLETRIPPVSEASALEETRPAIDEVLPIEPSVEPTIPPAAQPLPSVVPVAAASVAAAPATSEPIAPIAPTEPIPAPAPVEPVEPVASTGLEDLQEPVAPIAPAVAPTPAAPEITSPVATAIAEEAAAAVEQVTAEQLAIAASDQLASESEGGGPTSGEPIEAEEEPIEKGISVITREATVLGDIITEGHIDIVGRVKGNIDAKGDVAIHGVVRGDVDGSKIGLYSCRVKGNLNAGLGVIVDDNSIIGGDVKTKNIIFDGKVKGNIDADNVVVLRSHSYCLGDVSAASLAVEPGAILNGKVKTFVEGDLEAPFDEVM